MSNLIMENIFFLREIKSYFLGLLLALILTMIPFFLVFQHVLSTNITFFVIVFCAFIQFIVHLKYFLHLNFSVEYYWNIIFLIFTMIVICIIIFGSIWIMYNLNHHALYHR